MSKLDYYKKYNRGYIFEFLYAERIYRIFLLYSTLWYGWFSNTYIILFLNMF